MSKKSAVLVVAAVLFSYSFFKKTSSNLNSDIKISAPIKVHNVSQSSLAPAPAVAIIKAPATQTPLAKTISLEKIIENDDACAALTLFNNKLGASPTQKSKLSELYFTNSSFADSYKELKGLTAGLQPKNNRYARLLYYLAQANLVNFMGSGQNAIATDYNAARLGLETLSNEDPNNAAFAIFQLALPKKSSEDDIEIFTNHIQPATKFDSYYLEFINEMNRADSVSAVAYLLKRDYAAQVYTINWDRILRTLHQKMQERPEVMIKIGNLMTHEARESNRPSWEQGYSTTQYNTGRLFLSRSSVDIPSYLDMNEQASGRRMEDLSLFEKIHTNLTKEKCDEDSVQQELREFYTNLRQSNAGLNVSL